MALRKVGSVPVGTTPADIAQIKRKILAMPGARRDLRVIVRAAGVDREVLLDLLAMAVTPQEKKLAVKIRAKQRQLESVAGQIRAVTDDAERLANDPTAYLQFYSPFADGAAEDYRKQRAARLASQWSFAGMRGFAEWAEKEARTLGWWLRRNSQKESKLGILFLLYQVHFWTDKLFEPELARLLVDASEAAGENETFSPSQLTKLFQRTVAPIAKSRSDISTP